MTTSIAFGSDKNRYQVGTLNGPINIHQGQKESPPNLTSNVPFPRDPDFVPRGTLLDEIHAKSSTYPGSWVALVGLNGVGKSQLAIEYCYRVQDKSPKTWVFWIHAGNAARLEEGFQDAADRLKISNRHDPGANVFKLVYDWLRDNSDWVVILDNLADASFLHEPLYSKSIIEVHPMDISDAVELVNNKMDPPVTEMDAQSLAEALGFMPLAIIQATSYISRQSQSYSVSQYLAEFQRSEGRKSKLLGYEAGHSQRDRDANNSILITWRISFEQARKINSSAADLLPLMSFFDLHGISEDLLQTSIKNSGKSKDSGHDQQSLRALRKTLGKEHPSTINSMAFLASRYRNQGRSDEAEALGIEVLNLRMKASGEEHSSTINSMGSLALTYQTRGRLQEAEALGTQTLNL
ncbi:hypothetical protein N7488_001877 [Penicillium malachiteum]|nr:hypothetical protein N7488_001877 [Penicillium malachiteum]